MNDFNKPIRPIRGIQKSSLKKEVEIANQKYHEQLPQILPQQPKKKKTLLSFLQLIKEFFGKITSLSDRNPDIYDTQTQNLLIKVKSHLILIATTQPSTHSELALEFSNTWKELLEILQHLPYAKSHLLVDSFKTFPGRNSYSLHFYLTRFSGKEWFPVPFFDLLKQLHDEYQRHKKNSQLDRWIHLIDEMTHKTAE